MFGTELNIYQEGPAYFCDFRFLANQMVTYNAPELAVLNNEGDLNVVCGNDRSTNGIFINEGNGHFFFAGSFRKYNDPTRNITLGDLDSHKFINRG